MLLYFENHSYPDIADPVHILSKVLYSAYHAAFKEMLCVIKYVLGMKYYDLKFELNVGENSIWDLTCYSKNDYTGDQDSHWSVSGYILYMRNMQ